jgi:AcrR family transcriptional regulator
MVVARAGVAKGTFYVHFKDRAEFVDAMHARFHTRVAAAIAEATAAMPPGGRRLFCVAQTYLDVSLQNRGAKALSLEIGSDPVSRASMEDRRTQLARTGISDFEALGWDDAEAAAQLLAAMIREVAAQEFDAGHALPASRRSLWWFLDR